MTAAARTWQGIRRSRSVTAVGDFLAWWRDQLLDSLPAAWRERLAVDVRPAHFYVTADDMVLEGPTGQLYRGARQADPELVRAELGQVMAEQGDRRPPVHGLLDSEQVLLRSVNLPAAARENLRQVLAYELDRHTPFTEDQVYFDYRVVGEAAGGEKIRVALVLVPRELVDEMDQLAHAAGLELSGVDVRDPQGGVAGVNLLPEGRRASQDRRLVWFNLALAGLVLVLFIMLLWQTVAAREAAVEAFSSEVAQLVDEAKGITTLRDEMQATLQATRFLVELKCERAPVTDLLQELTQRLPDSAHLNSLSVNDNGVVLISGAADEAATLLAPLGESPVLDQPYFKGSIAPDPRTNKERFSIEAQLTAGERC